MSTFLAFNKLCKKKFKSNISNEFTDNLNITSLYFSQLAYFSPEVIFKSLTDLGAISISVYNKFHTQGFFVEFTDFVVVGFRGTELASLKKIRAHLHFYKTKFEGIDCHTGFVNLLKLISSRILLDLNEVNPSKPILFTGHSLGGALASLLALQFTPTHLVTFGSPRVTKGDIAKEKYSKINYNRIEIKNDIVPKLPPMLTGYENFGNLVILPEGEGILGSHKLTNYIDRIMSCSTA
jgi:hypothetical protein